MTQSWPHNPDRTLDTHTEFGGNAWQALWSSCCTSRLVAQTDPLGAATTMAHDAAHGQEQLTFACIDDSGRTWKRLSGMVTEIGREEHQPRMNAHQR